MRVSAPSNDTTRASPIMRRAVRSRLGSALGLSQPLSGFLAGSSSTALFRAAAVPGLLSPSERSPRLSRAPLSGPLAPLPFSTRVHGRTTRGSSARFPPTPTRERAVAGLPRRLGPPFPRAEARFPDDPVLERWGPPPTASFVDFEALFLRRVRSFRLGLPRPGSRCSPGVSPLQRLSLRVLGPSNPSNPRGIGHVPAPAGPGSRLRGLHAPPQRNAPPSAPGVSSPKNESLGSPNSADSGPLRNRPAPPLDGDSCSLDLGPTGRPAALALEASK